MFLGCVSPGGALALLAVMPSPGPASPPGCPYDFVSLDWLQQWLDEASPPRPIDNTASLCPHGKLHPDKIPTVKRVSECVADYFYQRYGGGPRLTGEQTAWSVERAACVEPGGSLCASSRGVPWPAREASGGGGGGQGELGPLTEQTRVGGQAQPRKRRVSPQCSRPDPCSKALMPGQAAWRGGVNHRGCMFVLGLSLSST